MNANKSQTAYSLSFASLRGYIIFSILVAAFIAMRLWRLTSIALDGDEIFSLLLARRDWSGLLAGAVQDAIHPPLFYALLKIWVWMGGESLRWLRLFPVLVSALCLPPFFSLCRNLGVPPGARNLALAIASVHPYAIFYAQHLRMYGLLMLMGLVSTWCFERYLTKPSRRALARLTLANIVLVYCHYYGWLIVGLEFIYLAWLRRRCAAFLSSSLLTALVFSPWAWAAARSLHAKGGLAENLGWVSRPTVGDMCWFFADLTGFAEFPKIGIWGALGVFAFLVWRYRRYRQPGFHWLMLISLAPAPLTYLASQWLPQSIWGHRHLLFTVWPLLVIFADSVWTLGARRRSIALALIGVWGAFAVAFHATDDRKFPWDTLTLAMLDAEHSDAARIPLFSVDPYLHYPIWFYLDCLTSGRTGPFGSPLGSRNDVPALAAKAAKFDVVKNTTVDAAQGSYFWIAYIDSAWHETRTPRQILEQRGCGAGPELTARDRFHSVRLIPFRCGPSSR